MEANTELRRGSADDCMRERCSRLRPPKLKLVPAEIAGDMPLAVGWLMLACRRCQRRRARSALLAKLACRESSKVPLAIVCTTRCYMSASQRKRGRMWTTVGLPHGLSTGFPALDAFISGQ